MAKFNQGEWSIKGVKTFYGHDGYGWECSLYQGKKRVSLVVEDGYGGGLQFHWLSNDHDVNEPIKAALDAHCGTLPREEYQSLIAEGGPTSFEIDRDYFVGDMVEQFLYARDLRKALKNKILWIDTDGVLKESRKETVTPDRIAVYKKQFGFDVALNDLPEAEALALYVGQVQS